MKRIGIILLGVCIWGFVMVPSGAVAHPAHMSAQSPFNAPKVKQSLHCMLLKHHHSALPFCPHTLHARNVQTQLKADCGDPSQGTPVQIQWSKTLMLCPSLGKASSTTIKYYFTPQRSGLPSLYPDRLERPPQHA
jgi:hypothetical protein